MMRRRRRLSAAASRQAPVLARKGDGRLPRVFLAANVRFAGLRRWITESLIGAWSPHSRNGDRVLFPGAASAANPYR